MSLFELGQAVRFGATATPVPAPAPRLGNRALQVGTLYVLGALVATLVNLAMQEAVRRADPDGSILAAMLVGTAAGFAAKYAFDKRFVFADPYAAPATELRKLCLYGLFSVGTTLVFWSVEFAAWLVWRTPAACYGGALVGLAIGFAAKYRLDRAFVFQAGAA